MTATTDAPAREPTVPSSRSGRKRHVLVAVGVAVAIVGSVFYLYTRSDLWLDEALSVNIARLPFSQLHDALKHDGAPPLFYVLLHLWTSVLGTSDVAARSLSAVAMLGAVAVLWFVARRWLGTRVAWLAAFVMITNPYAYRYATEARMYALVMLFVSAAMLFFQRALEKPSVGRLIPFALTVAALLYTQYWSFYLLATFTVMIAWMIWRDHDRAAAKRIAIATAVGIACFLPWAPTFAYQGAHTGTPWGTPVLPGLPIAFTIRDFAGGATPGLDVQEGWLLLIVLVPMLLLGIFGRSVDDRRIEVDIRTQREVRAIAYMGGIGLVVAMSLNYLAGSAFQTRYSAIVFPFWVLLVARGLSTLRDSRVLAVVCGIIVVLGFGGGVRNLLTNRTQAAQVASVLEKKSQSGDLVVYCPDQLGPSVHRLAPHDLDQVTYPRFGRPDLIDWVDYKKRLQNVDRKAFVDEAVARAGNGHSIWLVRAPGYITHKGVCEDVSARLAAVRPRLEWTTPNNLSYERPGLEQFPPASGH